MTLSITNRHLTRAREIYARFRGAADRWSVASRPLDAPSPTRRRQVPLLMESLAWHYLTDEKLRNQLDQHGLYPGTWRRHLLNQDGALAEAIRCTAEGEHHQLGQRTGRRWGSLWNHALAQLRLTLGTEAVSARAEHLGNLEAWLRLRQGCREGQVSGTLALVDSHHLASVATMAPRRMLFLCDQQRPQSMEELVEMSGLPAKRIARAWPLTRQIYLPLCRLDRAHLPHPLLPLSPANPDETRIWNTLAGEPRLPAKPNSALLIPSPGPTASCRCGLGSWSISTDCYNV